MKALMVVVATALTAFGAEFPLQQAEARKFWKEITGSDLPAGKIVFAVDAKVSRSGHDAYVLKSVGDGVRITGSNERSVWYGLYDLLERRGGCHWFWDGDRVPKKPAIDLAGLDVREESRFEYRAIRYFAHRGLTRFQAEHWGPKEWTQEIDWMLKRRLNCFMPRIGMDDTWQKAYPDLVPYPNAANPGKGDGLRGFDNRKPFWPLEYRGKLRKYFTEYAFARGMMIPTDFGTMSHWYSRTPVEFLEKAKPPFLPQSTHGYGEPSGRVWDVFQPGWLDNYWRLTEAFVQSGYGSYDLLHTIGLGERRCFTDRAKNLQMKKDVLAKIIAKAKEMAPDSKILLAGWDFYLTWKPEEVRDVLGMLNPEDTIVWDYEAEASRGHDHWVAGLDNNFTKWGVVGKFPYTFGIFLAYEQALDVRANYPVIEEREKVIRDDPFCRGYIFWPESSHTDTFLLRYFTANAWQPGHTSAELLPEFCRDRYGDRAADFEAAWRLVLPLGRLWGWGGNCVVDLINSPNLDVIGRYPRIDSKEYGVTPELFRRLAELPLDDEFRRRDVIDLARTAADRLLVRQRERVTKLGADWAAGKATPAQIEKALADLERGWAAFADILAQHTDYSLNDTLARLDAVEHVPNSSFGNVLMDNALCGYCRSHQYETARHWMQPLLKESAAEIRAKVAEGAKVPFFAQAHKQRANRILNEMLQRPLADFANRSPRDDAKLRAALKTFGQMPF